MGNPAINLQGMRFGRLFVLNRAANATGARPDVRWLCLCDCGSQTVARTRNLRAGLTKSCGCLFRDTITQWDAAAEGRFCYGCGLFKSRDRFGNNRSVPSGLSSRCRECTNTETGQRYKASMEAMNDTYIKQLLGDLPKVLPAEQLAPLIEAKRAHIRLLRLIREKRTP